jgi:glycosyltransferase involved in cell wall biosynthesis
VARRLPTEKGPAPVRALVARARLAEAELALRGGHDPVRALAAAEQLTTVPGLEAEAWGLVAEARAALGQGREALEAARRATDSADLLDALLVHHRVARAYGEPDEVARVERRIIDTAPAAGTRLDDILETLRSSDGQTISRLQEVLRDGGASGWESRLAGLSAEVAIVRATPDEVEPAVAHAMACLEEPLPIVVRALTARRDWEHLATVATTDAVRPDASAAIEIRRGASAALKAGRAAAAASLARRALEITPQDRFARETLTRADDQVAVADRGWQPLSPGLTSPTHAPRHRAILSVLAQSLPLRSGGYATRSHGILTGLQVRGWEVEGVTRLGFPYDTWPSGDSRTVPATDIVDGIAYHRVLEPDRRAYPKHPVHDYVEPYAAAIEGHARRHGAALVHASSFYANGLAAREVSRRLGIPYVYEMRGVEDLMQVSRDPAFRGSGSDRFLHEVEFAACAEAERVFVITDALRREMVVRGVPEDKLVVLPNGVHASRFEPLPRDATLEAQLGLQDKAVIGYAGSLVHYEGLDLLLEAVALVASARDDLRLVIVGDGAHANELHRIAARAKLEDVVTFTGRVPHEQIPRYLSLFDVAPFPRLPLPVCEMISPIKPFEAMASGLVPLVSSVAALTEIVQHEQTGLVFEKGSATALAHALTRLVDDPGLRRRLGDNAREWVRTERDWSSIVGIVDRVYREILG